MSYNYCLHHFIIFLFSLRDILPHLGCALSGLFLNKILGVESKSRRGLGTDYIMQHCANLVPRALFPKPGKSALGTRLALRICSFRIA